MPFVHLRVHTEYSVVDSTLRIDAAAAAARADAMPALAITDLSNLFGAVKFYKACRGAGVKPLIGVDVWLEPVAEADKQASRLLLLVQDAVGYHNVCELLARAWVHNAQRTQAWVKWAWLEELGSGLIVLSGADQGALGAALLAGDEARAETLAARLAGLFPQRFYIELQRAGLPQQELHVKRAVQLAAQLQLPVVATHPVQFLEADDYDAHEARVCIAEGETLANPRRVKRFSREQYLKTQAQMEALFADLPSALANSVQIARRCNLTLVLGKARLPDFATPDGLPINEHFRAASKQGLERRLEALFPDAARRDAERPRYQQRLEFEIETIIQMEFPGYFLIVSDFIVWAKEHGCPVGPGRGSGAGSLVAYALFITDLDPLRYGLLFERFLNPERVSMPDFDIDFCQANRDRVIDYVKAKYGRDAVSQIATFGTLASKAALRDVGRVLGMGYGHVDSVAKLGPGLPGKTYTLAPVPADPDPGLIYVRKEVPELEQREAAEEEVAELLALATRVEGLVRNVGMHAGGVLIAPGRITDFCPLYQQPGSDSAVSQFDKDDVEAIGLVKFDFLGLATLTILELAKDFIRARRKGQEAFAFETLPLDDKASYRLMSEGKTVAVFQLESSGMQRMLRDAKPSVFEDVIALVALYRPGPMDLIPTFCARKHGREEVEYPHPLMREVLEETYGIMVYQEQVMQVAQIVGGYSLGGADLLRRAMGKKKPEEMAQQREIFVKGAQENGLAKGPASQLFDLMEKFAGYGFNKSHAAAYALLAYQTAYMKRHHPAAFVAANMSAVMDDTDKVRQFHDDAVENGVRILPPDIHASDYRFVPVDAKTVRYGLGGIRGTGQSAIESILEARKERPFKDLYDFCRRVDKRLVNRRAIEAMVRAGAYDALEANRASVLATVGRAIEAAEQAERQASQVSLFGEAEASSDAAFSLVPAKPWDLRTRLTEEKVALGYCLSGHLFSVYAAELGAFPRTPLAKLQPSEGRVWMAGIVNSARVQMTRRGRMMVIMLDDGTAQLEVTVFNELFEKHREKLKEDSLVVVCGTVRHDEFSGGQRVSAEELLDIAAMRERYAARIRISMNGQADAKKLQELLAPYRANGGPGSCRVLVEYRSNGTVCEVALGDAWKVKPDERLLASLGDWLAPDNVKVVYAAA